MQLIRSPRCTRCAWDEHAGARGTLTRSRVVRSDRQHLTADFGVVFDKLGSTGAVRVEALIEQG